MKKLLKPEQNARLIEGSQYIVVGPGSDSDEACDKEAFYSIEKGDEAKTEFQHGPKGVHEMQGATTQALRRGTN